MYLYRIKVLTIILSSLQYVISVNWTNVHFKIGLFIFILLLIGFNIEVSFVK